MSKSKSVHTTSPEGSSSTETKSSVENAKILTDDITVINGDGTKIDLIVGEIYHDFSGQEKKCWYKFDKIGDETSYWIGDSPGGVEFTSISGFVTRPKTSVVFGTSLLYLGRKHGQRVPEVLQTPPVNTYLYFLNERRIIGVVVGYNEPELDKFIRLWPHNEKLVHKNVYYHKKKTNV